MEIKTKIKQLMVFVLTGVFFACGSGDNQQSEDSTADNVAKEVEETVADLEDQIDETSEEFAKSLDSFKEDLKASAPAAAGDAASSNTYKDTKGRTVYTFASEMPSYPGGDQEMFKFLRKNIKYPREARQNNVQGTSIVNFVVGQDGFVEDVELAKSSGDDLLDSEALRVVSGMSGWNPGKQNGDPVLVRYSLPIKFQLEN